MECNNEAITIESQAEPMTRRKFKERNEALIHQQSLKTKIRKVDDKNLEGVSNGNDQGEKGDRSQMHAKPSLIVAITL